MRTKDDQSLTAKLAMKQLGNQVVVGDWSRHIQRVLEEKYNVESGRQLIVDTANTINHILKIVIRPNLKNKGKTIIRTAFHIQASAVDQKIHEKWEQIL